MRLPGRGRSPNCVSSQWASPPRRRKRAEAKLRLQKEELEGKKTKKERVHAVWRARPIEPSQGAVSLLIGFCPICRDRLRLVESVQRKCELRLRLLSSLAARVG